MTEPITNLAEYGLAGVAIAAIGALLLIVKEVLNCFKNHLSHNTEALTELKDTIRELKTFLMMQNGNKKKK